MVSFPKPDCECGVALAERLGLGLNKREGHDLAGPCIACKSSDAFRLHMHTGVAQCYSCGGQWSPLQLTAVVVGDRERAKNMMADLGMFAAGPGGGAQTALPDPVEAIARQKGVTANSLRMFGAKTIMPTTIELPCYGPDGHRCTTFSISTEVGAQASKGLFAKGKPAGLFFPHVDSQVRLPQAGEVWHLAEGVKDAAALHELGLLACGLNTCRLAAKFARLFRGADIVLVPDRDRAGEEGAQFSARVLRGVAQSIRVAALPAEFQDSHGEDVRDVLRRTGGRELVLQAIADARPLEVSEAAAGHGNSVRPATACATIQLADGEPLTLEVSPAGSKPQRLVVVKRGDLAYRDQVNTDSSVSRERFVKKLANKLGVDAGVWAPLVEAHLMQLATEMDETASDRGNSGDGEKPSQATIAANMAAQWDLWHTPAKQAYATIPVDHHQEVWPVRSQTFKRYLAMRFFHSEGKAINSDALSAAINLIEAKAFFEGETHPVHVRVAEHEQNIYIDLCNNTWQVVKVTSQGWQIVDESPVRFRRSRGMLPLPAPESGGTVDQLREFVNVDDDTWHLVVAWLVATLRPHGPYLALALFAEQGSGKSTTGRLLRAIVDPNTAPLRAEPHDGRDLMIAASNSWCLALDNLSHLPQWLSDALCRLSTGGGFATRELYTDEDEVIFDVRRPVLLTSIEEVATRGDLLDRCLVVWLPAISEERRRPEVELLAAFEKVRPAILGALLDAVVTALQHLPNTTLPTFPRMADFALWVTAAETGLGWDHGEFLAAYQGNRQSAHDVAIEASSVARPLLDLLAEQRGWFGTASELLAALEGRVTDQIKRQKCWPTDARRMSGQLRRLAPHLRSDGWQVTFPRKARKRWVAIERLPEVSASQSALASSPRDDTSVQRNANPCGLSPHDADDADDAVAGPIFPPCDANAGRWEEGEL